MVDPSPRGPWDLAWLAVSPASHCDVVAQAAALLDAQWPTVAGAAGRERQLRRSRATFPTSFVALDQSPAGGEHSRVLGHVLVRAASEVADGLSAIAFSVVVSPVARRRGVGRFLMDGAEREARARGFSYLYLFTDDMEAFYSSCGYKRCERIAAVGQVARHFASDTLSALQQMVARQAARHAGASHGDDSAPAGTDAVASADAVWMRKALVEATAPEPTRREADCRALAAAAAEAWTSPQREVEEAVLLALGQHGEGPLGASVGASVCASGATVVDMTWERQVGPSCGLALLRILRRFLHDRQPSVSPPPPPESIPPAMLAAVAQTTPALVVEPLAPLAHNASLLAAAKARRISNEGELFSNMFMAQLAADAIGARMAVVPLEARVVMRTVAAKVPVLVAYDRDPNTHRPGLFGGLRAHWGLVRGCAWRPPTSSGGGEGDGCSFGSSGGGGGGPDQAPFELVVLVTHAMSAHAFCCRFDELAASNAQLRAAKHGEDGRGSKWVIPSGGVDLARACVVPLL